MCMKVCCNSCYTHAFTNPHQRMPFLPLWILCDICGPLGRVPTGVPLTAEVPALYNPPPTAVAEALDSVALSPVMGLCTSASALTLGMAGAMGAL